MGDRLDCRSGYAAVFVILAAICLVSVHTHLKETTADEVRLWAGNVQMEAYENGSTRWRDEYVPCYRVRVSLDLQNHGPKARVKVVVSLSYHDLRASEMPTNKRQAAPSQEFNLHFKACQRLFDADEDPFYVYDEKHLDLDFDIGHLAGMLHEGSDSPT